MLRSALYIGGVSAAATFCILWFVQRRARRPVSVREAAAKLQQAWADHRTYA